MDNLYKKPNALSEIIFDKANKHVKEAIVNAQIDIASGHQNVDGVERVEAIASASWQAPQYTKEIFSSIFQEDIQDSGSRVLWAKKGMDACIMQDVYKELKATCEHDPVMSMIAASELVNNTDFPSLFTATKEERKKQKDKGNNQQNSSGSQGKQSGSGNKESQVDDKVQRQMRNAMKKAMQSAKEGSEISKALFGKLAGVGNEPNKYADDVAERLKALNGIDKDKLKKISKLIGRLKSIAKKNRSKNVVSGKQKVTGVELGSTIEQLTSDSLVLAGSRFLKYEFYSRYIDNSLVQYSLKSNEKVGRGDIRLLVDRSGSMSVNNRHAGCSNMVVANAVSVVFASIAKKERRAFEVQWFNNGLNTDSYQISKAGKCFFMQNKSVTNAQMISKMLAMGCGGGTNLNVSLKQFLASTTKQMMKADIVIITDGYTEKIQDEVIEELQNIKSQKGFRFYGMCIGGGSFDPKLEKLLDKNVTIDRAEQCAKIVKSL